MILHSFGDMDRRISHDSKFEQESIELPQRALSAVTPISIPKILAALGDAGKSVTVEDSRELKDGITAAGYPQGYCGV
jgi:hypothetical protein